METFDTARWAGPERGVGGGSAQQPRGSATIAEVPLLPQTLASRPPRSAASRPAGPRSPPPSPSLVPSRAPHLVSASFSLLVEGKEKNKTLPSSCGSLSPSGKKIHKTRHGPGLPLLKPWPTRGGRSPGREAPQPPGVVSPRAGFFGPAPTALGPSLAPGPPTQSLHFSRSRAATPLINGVAPEGKVSVQVVRAAPGAAFHGPSFPGRGALGGQWVGKAEAESKG